MAPEYISQGRISEKIDVYSFGVLVLEILSSKRNNKRKSENLIANVSIITFKYNLHASPLYIVNIVDSY